MLPNHGIGDGIGDIEGLEENNSRCDEVDPSPVVVEEGPKQEGHVNAFDTAEFTRGPDETNPGQKAVTGILKKK